MNDQKSELSTPPLESMPDRSYWLDTLGVAQYQSIIDLTGDPAQLRERFIDVWKPELSAGEKTLKHHGGSDIVMLNLILIATFTEDKRGEVIYDISRVHLGDGIVLKSPIFEGRLARRHAVTMLFEQDPNALWDIELWEHWQDRRRTSFDLIHEKTDAVTHAENNWTEFASKALLAMGGASSGTRFCRAIVRQWEKDVFLAFRHVGQLDTLRDPDGRVKTGYRDDWTFVRFYEGMNRLDIVSDDVDRALKLSERIGASVLKRPCAFRPACNQLTWNQLDAFLKIICNPANDTFMLLEMIALDRSLWKSPIIRVSNTGVVRIEPAVVRLQEASAYAQTAKDVRSLKVGIMYKQRFYRIELHFPDPNNSNEENGLVLSYTDSSGHKDVAASFEKLVENSLGVRIHPKASRGAGRRKVTRPKPKSKGVSFWSSLLRSEIRDPEEWELKELDWLTSLGLIRYQKSVVFTCGDPAIPPRWRKSETHNCAGTVRMPFASMSSSDPFEQDPNLEFPCDTCNTPWRLNRFKPPMQASVTIELLLNGLQKYVESLLAKCSGSFEWNRGGYWTRKRGHHIDHVVMLGIAKGNLLGLDLAKFHPACWCGLTQEDVSQYGAHGMALPVLLAEKQKAIEGALKLGVRADLNGKLDGMVPVEEIREDNVQSLCGDQFKLIATANEITFRGREIFGSRDQRARLFFAMLGHFADLDKNSSAPNHRKFRTSQKFIELEPDGVIGVENFRIWISRTRAAINKAFPEMGLGSQIIESSGTGIRLGEKYHLEGFSLQDELRKFLANNGNR